MQGSFCNLHVYKGGINLNKFLKNIQKKLSNVINEEEQNDCAC